jgi:hypothetical protein
LTLNERAPTMAVMTDTVIYPRSPREMMAGWVHLPRFIDKIRLAAAGKLHPDYQPNFTKGFDGLWLQAAGLEAEAFIELVKGTITDGQVCDWVLKNAHKGPEVKAAFREKLFNYGRVGDEQSHARLKLRKEQAGLADRADVESFLDFIDADEKRL